MTGAGFPDGTATAPRLVVAAEPGEVCSYRDHLRGAGCAAAARGQAFPDCCGCGARAAVALEIVMAGAVIRVPFCLGHRGKAGDLAG